MASEGSTSPSHTHACTHPYMHTYIAASEALQQWAREPPEVAAQTAAALHASPLGEPLDVLVAPTTAVEVYHKSDRASWSHLEQPARNQWFDETLRKKDTFTPNLFGCFAVKMNPYLKSAGAIALTMCLEPGQLLLCWPKKGSSTNGEGKLCEGLGISGSKVQECT